MTIIQNEDIRVGKPVIQGSRVAVEDVVEAFYERGKSQEEVAEAYNISEEAVEEALRYHHQTQHGETEAVTA
ncbi:MAG: DUF433 domain-containing protein [Candidatus Nanohaloarchaea archaeon]|nr:DUF433 domain-containing protein [Candidatus Nanohaloarchaea archaeon]